MWRNGAMTIKLVQDAAKVEELRAAIKANGMRCPHNNQLCVCQEFLNDKAAELCPLGMFTKKED